MPNLELQMPSSTTPTSTKPERTLWTVRVNPALWPAFRWLMQIIPGLFLLIMFGPGSAYCMLVAGPERPLYVGFFGIPVGLCAAATVNGFWVARFGRRFTWLAVMLFVVGGMAYMGLFWGIAIVAGTGKSANVVKEKGPTKDETEKLPAPAANPAKGLDEAFRAYHKGMTSNEKADHTRALAAWLATKD